MKQMPHCCVSTIIRTASYVLQSSICVLLLCMQLYRPAIQSMPYSVFNNNCVIIYAFIYTFRLSRNSYTCQSKVQWFGNGRRKNFRKKVRCCSSRDAV